MDFDHSEKVKGLLQALARFMDAHIYPQEQRYYDWVDDPQNQWKPWPGLEPLKREAQAQGLWNLFLPKEYGRFSPGLTNLEYAPLAEQMGRVLWASEVFNCSAPDTGNMEVLAKYGTQEQQEQWLTPLLAGRIRSAYLHDRAAGRLVAMRRIWSRDRAEGNDYVINGRKWWISGIMDPRCQLLLLLGETDPSAARYSQHSLVIIPRDTPGVRIVRSLRTFGNLRFARRRCGVAPRERAHSEEEHRAGERAGLRDRAGAAWPGTHSSLHALGRPGAARAGDHGAAGRDSGGIRSQTGRAEQHPPGHRPLILRDRTGAVADAEGGRPHGQVRQQGSPRPHCGDQDRRAANGANRS